MPDQLHQNNKLKDIYDSITAKHSSAIIESNFDNQGLSVKIKNESLLDVLSYLKSVAGFNSLTDIICLDNLIIETEGEVKAEKTAAPVKRFTIIYLLFRFPSAERIKIITGLEEKEKMTSIFSLYKSSNWLEREIFDLFGIEFEGHPNLSRIFMDDDWKGHPLRKDYPLNGIE